MEEWEESSAFALLREQWIDHDDLVDKLSDFGGWGYSSPLD